MSAAESFLAEAERKGSRASSLAGNTQPEKDLQGVCHELLEIIEGQEYIIEDAQFAIIYGDNVINRMVPMRFPAAFERTSFDMIQKMEEVKATAQELYDKTFNCKRPRARAGFEVER